MNALEKIHNVDIIIKKRKIGYNVYVLICLLIYIIRHMRAVAMTILPLALTSIIKSGMDRNSNVFLNLLKY